MDLAALMEGLSSSRVASGVRVCDLTEDSRTVVPGSLFIARRGLTNDGRAFVPEAQRAGAVAVLTDDPDLRASIPVVVVPDALAAAATVAERFYGIPSRELSLVGVTGTNGKTTTTYLVWQVLNAARRRCGLVGTVVIDDGREVGPAAMTTPPAVELSRSLRSMVEGGCEAAALEVSSHALSQRRADALRFRVGVFTNLTGDHLDYHGTMESYADAKARLFDGLSADGVAIVNADDPAHERMIRNCGARVIRCSLAAGRGAPCVGEVREATLEGMRLGLRGPWGEIEPRVGLVGSYNAMNVLQAAASCHALGLGPEAIERGLGAAQAPPGRLQRVSPAGPGPHVFVDYAHSDDSLRQVLGAVGALLGGRAGRSVFERAGAPAPRRGAGRLWVVFGCGGERDRTKRPRMGLAASELADHVVVTSDNPRREQPGAIIDEILAGIPASRRDRVEVQADRARAIAHALERACEGDAVVIAGKGHETEQVLPDGKGGTYRTHFDDAEVARAAIGAPAGSRAIG